MGRNDIINQNGLVNYDKLAESYDNAKMVGNLESNGITEQTLAEAVKNDRSQLAENVHLSQFGAKGDGVTDDTIAIQNALIYAFANKKNITSDSSAIYAVSSTIIIPQNSDFSKSIDIDFNNATFKMLADVTLFTSGYDNGDVLTTNFGTANDSHNSFGIMIRNFKITTSIITNGGTLLSTALKIQDYHQGCLLFNISSEITQTILESCDNYYCIFDGIRTILSGTGIQSRFIFTGYHNLNKFMNLIAANSTIGYDFRNAVIACQMTTLSIERMGIGIQFNSEVYDCVIENCYCENITDTVVKFLSYIDNVTFRNNYVNFINQSNMYFIDYVPLAKNNIIIEQDNMFITMPDDSHIFKTIDNTVGYNQITFKRPPKVASTIDLLYADNTKFSKQAIINQIFNLTTGKAKLVNNYAVGIYSGRYTGGFATLTGANWVNNSNNILTLDTKIVFSDTQNIYVNLRLSIGGLIYIKGTFIGNVFYEYIDTGVVVSDKLALSVVNGFQRITSVAQAGTITVVYGEVRLI